MIGKYFDLHSLSIDPERASEASEASSANIQLRTEPATIQLRTEHADGQIIDITSAIGQIEHADGQSERQIELAKRQIEHAHIEQADEHSKRQIELAERQIEHADGQIELRRGHLHWSMALQTCPQLPSDELTIITLHLTFGRAPCLYEWGVISETICDIANELIKCDNWDPVTLHASANPTSRISSR